MTRAGDDRRRTRRLGVVLVTLGALTAVGLGCNDNQLGREKRRPNQPPQTYLTSGPPDSTYGTNYRVELFWSGDDPDGTIDHYDFILVDHPASNDSIAGGQNDVVVASPAADDPRWVATAANDTTIVTRADTLRVNPAPPPGAEEAEIDAHNHFVRRQTFERWHTLFVRAVDNEGLVDESPEYRSFNSRTLAPVVELLPPVDPSLQQFSGPPVIVFNWRGSDDTGAGTTIEPIASRWTLLPTRFSPQQHYVGYPDTLYRLPESAWSLWHRWDARDGSGRQAIVRNLQPVDAEGRGRYIFAVQAMDEAGAVTPIFDARTHGSNNVALVFVNEATGAQLVVDEPFNGTFRFVVGSPVREMDVAAGQPITFRWRGDASHYGGRIEGYRFGWNILNPNDDGQWEQNWCSTCVRAPTRVFASGTQRFFLETRDNADTVTRAQFEVVVHQVTRARDLLFVDDTVQPQAGDELTEDNRWARALLAVLDRAATAGQPFVFDFGRDYYDVAGDHQGAAPPLSVVFDYKAIVWAVVEGGGRSSAIAAIADFFDPFVLRNQNRPRPFDYLSNYVDNGGKFWLSGTNPAYSIFKAIGSWPSAQQLPANITNFEDGLTPHPDQDSVGVRSFLWKLGVEATDLGSGGRAPAPRVDRLDQGCTGLRRATPQGWDIQTFTTTAVAGHAHPLEIPTADVNHPSPAGGTYETGTGAGHTHFVTLSADRLLQLARGERLSMTTSAQPLPEMHTHVVEIYDQLGLWGAPAVLQRDNSLWPLPRITLGNPAGGRQGVELYNMASFMANPRLGFPLEPERGLSFAPYVYTSVTPENPTASPPVLYPLTADNQPVVLLRKQTAAQPYYARCIAGFEPWRLQETSFQSLVEFILLRHFRLGAAAAS